MHRFSMASRRVMRHVALESGIHRRISSRQFSAVAAWKHDSGLAICTVISLITIL